MTTFIVAKMLLCRTLLFQDSYCAVMQSHFMVGEDMKSFLLYMEARFWHGFN